MWQNEMIMVLRYMVGDSDESSYKYCDEQLQDILVISALIVNSEVNFFQTYTIRPTAYTISPDPTSEANRDDDFIALVCLKSAFALSMGEYKKASNTNVSFRDRDTQFSLQGKVDSLKAVANDFLKQYNDSKWEFQLQKRSIGRAILGSLNLPYNHQGYNYGTYRNTF